MLRGSGPKHAFLPALALIIFCLLSLPLTRSPFCWQSENAYLMSVLRARGRPISFKSTSTTSDYLEAVMVLSNGSFVGYADTNRMPTALGYGI